MTNEQFVYWLQGFAELNGSPPTMAQWDNIRAHLQTVFVKVTPSVIGKDDNKTPYKDPSIGIPKIDRISDRISIGQQSFPAGEYPIAVC